eukprot:TRINITY_DN18649_c2_g1_i1.p1 TRINITY_DN18649_c2_g1~~TRINITY_DN18649_c2_g1_i1.p1  ORF type:complete len:164 (+),score=23.63 TRINITY_DN18649_c2_g1_i1:113-604(+)
MSVLAPIFFLILAISCVDGKVCKSANLVPAIQAMVDPYPTCYDACPELCKSIQPTVAAYVSNPKTYLAVACQAPDAWKCIVSHKQHGNKTAKEHCAAGVKALKDGKVPVAENISQVDTWCAQYPQTTTTTTTTTTKGAENVSASAGLMVNFMGVALVLISFST